MDLDLVTNGSKIRDAIDLLSSGKLGWVVLGYSTNKSIDIIETGDDSLEDMFEEFHISKIMYGFASVTDPNTQLKKNVFLYWQGSGAPQNMKTTSVQHSNVIRDICKPVHVSFTARDEQDLDAKEIMSKVASSSGSNYSFHKQTKQIFETTAAVKSENNDAKSNAISRKKELAQLNSLKKESIPTPSPAKPVHNDNPYISNIVMNKSNNSNFNKAFSHKPATNISMKPANSYSTPVNKVGTNYSKINPLEDIQKLKQTQKSSFESEVTIKSENNTAEKERDDRKKELSNMINNRRTSTDTQIDEPTKVGTNYTKINPLEEIRRLRMAANNSTEDNLESSQGTNYKRVDPKLEIQMLRRMSTSNSEKDDIEPVSPSYQRVNPAEEIKKLKERSKSTTSNEFSADHPPKTMQMNKPSSPPPQRIEPYQSSKAAYTSMSNTGHHVLPSNAPAPISPSTNQFTRPPSIKSPLKSPTPVAVQTPTPVAVQTPTPVAVQTPISATVFTPPSNHKAASPARDSTPQIFDFNKQSSVVTPSVPVTQAVPELEGQCARTIYDYQATDNDEISFDIGEMISQIEQVDSGWWVGMNPRGERGMFPSNYVEMIESSVKTEDSNTHELPNGSENNNYGITVKAIFQYFAQENDEISFEEGEQIFNVEQVDEGWWQGSTAAGVRGLFPANYVEPIN